MRVIGAGFGRTGTESIKLALEQLLDGPCYHMHEVIARPDHLKRWAAFARSGRRDMDWRALLDGYVAGVDWPICNYYRELMEVYPDAKVLLSVRDPDSWFDSFTLLVRVNEMFNRVAWLVPRYRRFRAMTDRAVWHIFRDRHDRAHCIEVHQAHVAAVKAHVPTGRLLVFRVQDGWPPLCEFLGLPVPDTPFPHVNSSRELLTGTRRRVIVQVARTISPALLVLAIGVAASIYLLR